jgi:hypothetical protein
MSAPRGSWGERLDFAKNVGPIGILRLRTHFVSRRGYFAQDRSRSVLFDSRRELIDYCRACLAHDFVLGVGASRTTDGADHIALVDQGMPLATQ